LGSCCKGYSSGLGSRYRYSRKGNLYEYAPSIAYDGSRSLVVWYNYYYGTPGVFGRFVNNQAQPEDTIITVALATDHYGLNPRVEFDGGNYLVVWADRKDIFGQFVSPKGELVGPKITIAGGEPPQKYPDLAFDGSCYLVVWAEGTKICGQRVATNGQLIGDNFTISENTTNTKTYPGVAAAVSNYLVAWSESRSNYDIYGNVDVPVGIAERSIPPSTYHTTIISGPLRLPADKPVRVFDLTGRRVDP